MIVEIQKDGATVSALNIDPNKPAREAADDLWFLAVKVSGDITLGYCTDFLAGSALELQPLHWDDSILLIKKYQREDIKIDAAFTRDLGDGCFTKIVKLKGVPSFMENWEIIELLQERGQLEGESGVGVTPGARFYGRPAVMHRIRALACVHQSGGLNV